MYMWENMDKIIQIIESRIDLISKTSDLYDPQYCSKDNEYCSLKSSDIIRPFVQMKKPSEFAYGLNHTVHPLMIVCLSWKVVFVQDKKTRVRHFHNFAMNSYPHQKIFPWKISLLCIHWNRKIFMIMILYVSCQEVWFLMTS